MLAAVRSFWERLSSLGIAGQPATEQRRIRLTNQSALLGTLTCASFSVGFALAGAPYRVPMLANLAGVVLLSTALVLGQRGARTLARIGILLPANLIVLAGSMVLGGRVGFVYYFFLFAVVAFLLFSEDEPVLRWSFGLFSTACYVLVRIFGPRDDAVLALITPFAAQVLDIVSAVAVIGTVMVIVHLFTGETTRAEARLADAHARSERLLLNILPLSISTRLKDDDRAIADGFAEVTVLFADLVGFTELSQKLLPEELVKMLNSVFSAFDDLASHFGIEKIKTIGDCYMVAAGLPERRKDHAEAVARMALGMRDAIERINRESGSSLRVRIGVHTGPVVAGVIGKRKFIYDLWGDTVNTASRMESSGMPQEIQVTRDVYELLKGSFVLEPRGTITVKGKGEMETFLLKSGPAD